ncbi:MAG TPA: hypothetical protein VMJ73_07825, partial [Rhizomicrobium sp.]|nr:hypothetical protein [Rhizomicrobium sp.]
SAIPAGVEMPVMAPELEAFVPAPAIAETIAVGTGEARAAIHVVRAGRRNRGGSGERNERREKAGFEKAGLGEHDDLLDGTLDAQRLRVPG